jgi:nicotinate-nucleotide adenylyltransferase
LKRIGLFGGTFNPIHNGHLWAATSVREGFGLDSVILIPAAIPPHKRSKEVAPAMDRLEMIRLSVTGGKHLAVSDVELARSGPSYSIDTVRHFRARSAAENQLFFIVGLDAFLEIDTWKYFEDLFMLIPMIVLDRPASLRKPDDSFSRIIHDFLQRRISGDYTPSGDGLSFSHPDQQTIHLFPGEMMDISSSLIRQQIGRGETASDTMPPPVMDYIRRKGLYR